MPPIQRHRPFEGYWRPRSKSRILSLGGGMGETAGDYLRRRGGSPLFPGSGDVGTLAQYPPIRLASQPGERLRGTRRLPRRVSQCKTN